MQAEYGLGRGRMWCCRRRRRRSMCRCGSCSGRCRSGARLVVAAPDGHRDPAYLARVIVASSGDDGASFVPSMLAVFVGCGRRAGSARRCGACSSAVRRCRPDAAARFACGDADVRRCTTCTGRRRRRCDVTCHEVTAMRTWSRCRSVRRCGTPGCSCWMRGCGRCRWVWRVSCIWRVCSWRGGMSVVRI